MRKILGIVLTIAIISASAPLALYAENTAVHGQMSGKTFIHGLTSLLIWPGLGQYLNGCEKKKNITHALVGIIPPFRLWSGWDALVDRQGGRWDGKI